MVNWSSVSAANISAERRWDAEYFVNPYNDYLGEIFAQWHDWVSLSSASLKLTSGHTPLHHDVTEGDTLFITVECVDPLALNLEKAKRVWAHHVEGELSRVSVKQGDVLITIKRRIGLACPILSKPGVMAVNQDVVVMTPTPGLRPGYIAAVLNSRVGQFQALRHATEQMNPYINVATLGRLLIPRVSEHVQVAIEEVVEERLRLLRKSVDSYHEAEAELLDRLGWAELAQQSRELTYSANFSALASAGRSDAEFFQPQYHRLRERIHEIGGKPIGEFCPPPNRGVQPEFDDDGSILALDSKSIRPRGVEPSGERITQAFYNSETASKGHVRQGDVLLNSTGRGTLGRAACYHLNVQALCDNHISILRPNPNICNPRYLALFLNSPLGQMQSEQLQTGSSGQLEIYPEHIKQLMVFLPYNQDGKIDLEWQARLAAKVESASRAREEANAKLAEAKRLVEEALA